MWHTLTAVGNLGRDPEMRFLPNGTAVTSFSIAVNKEYTSAGGENVKQTIWIRVSIFGKSAEACNQYLKKGSRVLVVGELTPDKVTGGPRVWKNKEGEARTNFEVNASIVRFLSTKDNAAITQDNHEGVDVPPDDNSEEDFPF